MEDIYIIDITYNNSTDTQITVTDYKVAENIFNECTNAMINNSIVFINTSTNRMCIRSEYIISITINKQSITQSI